MTKENKSLQVSPPRLPYHPALKERFDIDIQIWRALTDAIYPAAKATESIILALSYCKARGLDIMKKPVEIVPMWSSEKKAMVETVWPGIGELRITATRTGNYAGIGNAEFGEDVTETLGGIEITYPKWCSVTVYRFINGTKCEFKSPRIVWKETYATKGKDTKAPNTMWGKRPYGQIEKCAEAAALRRAFPEEMGNQMVAEEMEGKELLDVSPKNKEPNGDSKLSNLSHVIDNAKEMVESENESIIMEQNEEFTEETDESL